MIIYYIWKSLWSSLGSSSQVSACTFLYLQKFVEPGKSCMKEKLYIYSKIEKENLKG